MKYYFRNSESITALKENRTSKHSSVVYIVTSSSISKLLKLNELLSEFGYRLILCNASPATEGIFKITGLDVVFEFAHDHPSALALIKNLQLAKK